MKIILTILCYFQINLFTLAGIHGVFRIFEGIIESLDLGEIVLDTSSQDKLLISDSSAVVQDECILCR